MALKLKMRAFCLAVFSLMMAFYPASTAFSEEIVALVSFKHESYFTALKGVESACDCTIKPYFLDGQNVLKVLAKVRRHSPKVLLAVGSVGLMASKQIKGIPIVYSSVTRPERILSVEKNIIGTSMDVPVDKQLIKFLEFAPKVKRIGFIYDPALNGDRAEVATATAKALGVELVTREVVRVTQVVGAVNEIRKDIDAFWVVPDATTCQEVTLRYLMTVAIEEWIPVLIFSEKHVREGATIALAIDQFRLGVEAGKMLKEVIAGTKPQDVTPQGPRGLVFHINTITARKLGLIPDDPIIKIVSLIK